MPAVANQLKRKEHWKVLHTSLSSQNLFREPASFKGKTKYSSIPMGLVPVKDARKTSTERHFAYVLFRCLLTPLYVRKVKKKKLQKKEREMPRKSGVLCAKSRKPSKLILLNLGNSFLWSWPKFQELMCRQELDWWKVCRSSQFFSSTAITANATTSVLLNWTWFLHLFTNRILKRTISFQRKQPTAFPVLRYGLSLYEAKVVQLKLTPVRWKAFLKKAHEANKERITWFWSMLHFHDLILTPAS